MNKKRLGIIILSLMLVIFSVSLFFVSSPYELDLDNRLAPFSKDNLLGTDTLGRDLFSRLVIGFFISLIIGGLSSIICLILSLTLALIASYNKKLDNIILLLSDSIKTLPGVLIAAILMTLFGPSLINILIVLIMIFTPQTLRLIRGRILVVKELDYVLAQKILGVKNSTIIFKTMFFNIKDVVFVNLSFIFTSSIIAETTLSFIGAGLDQSIPSLGNIIKDAKDVIFVSPMMIIIPIIIIALMTLSINIINSE